MAATLVSLGTSCQCAHQLARFAHQRPDIAAFHKSPFDWLICPPLSATSWLKSGLEDFRRNELSVRQDRVYWKKQELWFWHAFFTKTEAGSILDIDENVEWEHTKLCFQRDKFRSLDPERTIFFNANTQNNLATEVYSETETERYFFTQTIIDQLHEALKAYFQAPVNLQFVTREDRAEAQLTGKPNIHFLPHEHSDWQGSNADWNQLLEQVLP